MKIYKITEASEYHRKVICANCMIAVMEEVNVAGRALTAEMEGEVTAEGGKAGGDPTPISCTCMLDDDGSIFDPMGCQIHA